MTWKTVKLFPPKLQTIVTPELAIHPLIHSQRGEKYILGEVGLGIESESHVRLVICS